jgi:opacity protein-like surface antigen
MKKFATLAALALVASTSAMAADIADPAPGTTNRDVCTGASAAKYNVAGGPGSPYTTTGSFIKTGFAVQCSSNTFVTFQNRSGTMFLVGATSSKGNQSYRGSSNGGAVVLNAACGQSTTPCAQSDAQTAASAASSM